MRRTFAAVLCDLDGTLIDSEPLHCEAHRRFLATQGIVITEAEILGNIGKSDRAFYRALMERFGKSADDRSIEAWMAAKTQVLIGIYREGALKLMPGVREFLDHAATEGVPCMVVTSSHRELADVALEVTGLATRLPARICHDDTPLRKPHPDPYLLAAARLGVPAARCLVIEDSVFGITAGVKTGACTVAVRGYTPEADALAAGAHRLISSLAELIPLRQQLATSTTEEPIALVRDKTTMRLRRTGV